MDKMRDSKYRSGETKRINIMLLSIVVAFAVCWLPLTIFNTVFDWNHQIIATCNHNLLFLLCHLTAMISTCVNPIFYGFLNKNFQRDLQFFFNFCDFRSRDDDYETIAMSTMHTDVSKTSLKQASPVAFKKINNNDNEKIWSCCRIWSQLTSVSKQAQPTTYFHYLFNQGMGLKSLKKNHDFLILLFTAFVVTVIITFGTKCMGFGIFWQ